MQQPFLLREVGQVLGDDLTGVHDVDRCQFRLAVGEAELRDVGAELAQDACGGEVSGKHIGHSGLGCCGTSCRGAMSLPV